METAECRYSEQDGHYYFVVYQGTFAHDLDGPVAERPEWLTAIVNVATVGEHFLTLDPPPERVLWFKINSNLELVGLTVFPER